MSPNTPRVSVIMAVYNGRHYVREAVESVLDQSLPDFEFIVIDDCSTDETGSILRSYSDPRIRVIRNSANLGLPQSLNRGLNEASGEYIARMDADDINHPQRFRKQVDFLDSHPEIGICGTWIQLFGDGSGEVLRYPADSASIKSLLLFHSPLAHPTIMARRDVLVRNQLLYSDDYPCAEDYELWVRCSRFLEFSNVQEVLYRYRMHPGQETRKKTDAKNQSTGRIRLDQIRGLRLSPTEKDLEIHARLARSACEPTWDFIEKAGSWLLSLHDANQRCGRYPREAFSRMLADRWFDLCYNSRRLGLRPFIGFMRSPLRTHTSYPAIAMIKFGAKSLLRK